ncbi:MAG: hypothetical protein HYT08_04745 [Candidatus Levybacteria bacterium]|nr:hypothetical protein [Candidatus Levybacteria bacterium]
MQKGYLAISSIIIITAVVFVIAVTVSYLSIGEGQTALSLTKAEQKLNLQDSCAEELLLRLRSNTNPVAVNLPEGDCNILWSSDGAGNYTIYINSFGSTYGKYFTILANRDYSVTVTSWQQTN